MNTKLKVFSLLLLTIVCVETTLADISLPAKAMGMPKVFQNEEESWNWDNIARERNWGECSSQFWRVYIDREGVKAYESPKPTSKVVNTFKFMNKEDILYVAKIQNGYALLYKEKYEQTNLDISKQAISQGWVSVDELLLWPTCPRTIYQVYQKAVILKDPSELQDPYDINVVSPGFSKSPFKDEFTGFRASDLEFYFVYKEVNGSVLLLEDNKTHVSMASSKKGWMKRGMYTSWNDRLCLEPNFGSNLAQKEAAVFADKASTRKFKLSGEFEGIVDSAILWRESLREKRWSPKKVRFPVIDIDKNYIATVGTISALGGVSKINDNSTERDNLNEKITAIETKLRRINVVFVMDGTSSMRNYYQPMAKALTQAMSQNEMRGANMYFGAVVYRNYADEKEGRLVDKKQLTQDYNSVANWLVSRECRSVGSSHYEAMYYGIETALDQMNWSEENCNFLVLVGDAANADPDARKKTIDGIAKKMADKGINFVVFQANHMDHSAYHDFSLQMQKIMFSELKFLTGKKIVRSDFKLNNQLYNYKYKNFDKLIISAGFRFAEINKSESESNLKNLVEEKIVDFKRQAEENLIIYKKALDAIGGDFIGKDSASVEFEVGAISILKSMGFSDHEIQIAREHNLTLKIKGFASRVARHDDVFALSVFMAKPELDLLIQSLSSVNNNISENPRKDLQDALKKLALSYFGQAANADDLEVDAIMDAVRGITSISSRSALSGVNLKDITNPAKVPQATINSFLETIATDVERLEKRRADKSCYFECPNGLRYYYILFEDMPLQNN